MKPTPKNPRPRLVRLRCSWCRREVLAPNELLLRPLCAWCKEPMRQVVPAGRQEGAAT